MTRQLKETIYYKENEYRIKDTPLDAYLQEKNISFPGRASNCWRGYTGKWEVKDDKLYLINFHSIIYHHKPISEQEKIENFEKNKDYYKEHYRITGANEIANYVSTEEILGLDYLFPGQEEVFADWFTGEIRIPYGKVLYQMMYSSIYEKYTVLEFKEGILIGEKKFDNEELIADYSVTLPNFNQITIELTKEILDALPVNDIIYAEFAEYGAMGCAGQVMIYIIKDEKLICYKANLLTDEDMQKQVAFLLSKYSDWNLDFFEIEKQTNNNNESQLIYYEGGFSNNVFVKRNVSLKAVDKHFVYEENNKEYHIYSSVYGVFKNVAYRMEKIEMIEKDDDYENYIQKILDIWKIIY